MIASRQELEARIARGTSLAGTRIEGLALDGLKGERVDFSNAPPMEISRLSGSTRPGPPHSITPLTEPVGGS